MVESFPQDLCGFSDIVHRASLGTCNGINKIKQAKAGYLMGMPDYVNIIARNQEGFRIDLFQLQVHRIAPDGGPQEVLVGEVGKRYLVQN